MNNQDIVKQILNSNIFLTLGTTDGNIPWTSALFFAADEKYNLYFTSYNDSLHVKNIIKNPDVAVVIFDSNIIPGSGKGQGIQMKAKCFRVPKEDLIEAIEVLYSKRFPDRNDWEKNNINPNRFSKPDGYVRVDHIYKIEPEKIYIMDKAPGKKDIRTEVNINY